MIRLLPLLILLAQLSFGQDFLREKSAIDFAKDGDLKSAIKTLEELVKKEPENPRYLYNLGTAFLMNKDYEKAAEYLNKAAASEDKEIKEKALYNLGNAFYQSQKYPEALNSYKNVLKMDSNNQKARENLELTLAKLQQQKQQQKQNRNNNDKNQKEDNKKEQNKQDRKKNDKDKSDENRDNGENNKKQEKKEQNKNDDKKQQEQSQRQEQKNQEQRQKERPNPEDQKKQEMKRISKEAALQLLKALEQEEKNNKIKQRPIQSKGVKRDKDW